MSVSFLRHFCIHTLYTWPQVQITDRRCSRWRSSAVKNQPHEGRKSGGPPPLVSAHKSSSNAPSFLNSSSALSHSPSSTSRSSSRLHGAHFDLQLVERGPSRNASTPCCVDSDEWPNDDAKLSLAALCFPLYVRGVDGLLLAYMRSL